MFTPYLQSFNITCMEKCLRQEVQDVLLRLAVSSGKMSGQWVDWQF